MMYGVGDIVLVLRGQKTSFFEVIHVENDLLVISDGWVQISKTPDDVELICKANNRQDKKIPFIRYFS